MKGMKSHDYDVMMQEILPLCMWHLATKGCKMAIIRLSCVFKKLCPKIVDSATMGDFKQDVALIFVLLEHEFPLRIFWCYDTPLDSFSERIRIMWSNPHMVDVTYWMLLQKLEGICEIPSKAKRKHGRRLCTKRNMKVLHIILAMWLMWDEKEDACMNDNVLEGSGHAWIMSVNLCDITHSFLLQNVELMSTWCM